MPSIEYRPYDKQYPRSLAVRASLIVCIVMVLTSAVHGHRVLMRSTAQCVADSDIILVGSLFDTNSRNPATQYFVRPVKMLRGPIPRTFDIGRPYREGDSQNYVIFAERTNKVDASLREDSLRSTFFLKDIERMIDWCDHPEKYIDHAEASKTPDFLLVTLLGEMASTT